MAKKVAKKKTIVKPKQKKKKVRIRYGRIFLALLILFLVGYITLKNFDTSIKNIYIENNHLLTDQYIIEKAKLENYPSTFQEITAFITSNLKKDVLLKDVTVSKKGLREVHIKVYENTPLFYDKNKNKVVLLDGRTTTGDFQIPILINYTPDKLYQKLVKKMGEVDKEIIERISEIEYNPNDVDQSRFLLSMADGNYVYLSLNKFQNINSYIDIIKKFENKKGILYLDSGEYFKIIEN